MTYCNKNDANCIDLNDENNKAQFIKQYGAAC